MKEKLLSVFRDVSFYFNEDKEVLISYFSDLLDSFDEGEALDELYHLIEEDVQKYRSFDPGVLYDPRKLLLSLLHDDFLGGEISHEEFFAIYEDLQNLELHQVGLLKDKEWIESTYDIKVVPLLQPAESKDIKAEPIEHLQFLAAIPVLRKEIEKYPPLFIKNIQLEQIILGRTFFLKNPGRCCIPLGGFETNGDNHVYLSFQRIKKSFDHELYHQAMSHYNDINQRGDLRKQTDSFYDIRASHKPAPGFAVNYGKENIAEDQATVAEYMLRDYERMMHRSKTDSVLRKKIDLVKAAYLELSDGFMDEEYLKNLVK